MRIQCRVCGGTFSDELSAREHLLQQHQGFLRNPLALAVQRAIPLVLLSPPAPKVETVALPGSMWGFIRK